MPRSRRTPVLASGVVLAAAVLTGCAGPNNTVDPPRVPEDEQAQAQQLENQVGETDVPPRVESGLSQKALEGRVGQRVHLGGEVTGVIGEHALTLGGREVGEEAILVVARELPAGVAPGDFARAPGEVVRFTVREAEEDLGVDLPDEQLERYAGEPAVIATSVATG